MATAQIDPKLLRSIRTTQKLLGEHISKPPLLEKYLAKPPFRFLHDIVCSVISNTDFMKDVFTPHELKYDNVSSPDDKREFLKKAINAIEVSSGEKCNARTSKILAGKEPEKTNELLHLLVKAITNAARVNPADSREIKPKKTSESNKGQSGEKLAEVKSKAKEDPESKKTTKSKAPLPRTAVIKPKPGQVIPKEKDVKRIDLKKIERQETTVKKSKAAVSSSSTSVKKMPSKEVLVKPKQEVIKKTPPSSSTNLAKKSSSSLEKAKSKTLLPRMPSISKMSLSKTEVRKGKSNEKLHSSTTASRTNSDIGVKRDTSHSADNGMPPATIEEIPLQRPVTRTKYRQGNNGDDTASKSSSKECLASKNPSMEDMHGDDAKHDLLEEESRGSSTSEEVITEHMNEKISEWRATSAEDPDNETPSREWVPEGEQENGSPTRMENASRIFESEENCSVQRKVSNTKCLSATEKTDDDDAFPSKPSSSKNKQLAKRPVTVIMDNEEEDDEDESYLVQERKESLDDMVKQSMGLVNAVSEVGMLSQDNRSLLVNQILETQRELENFGGSGISDMQRELAERDQEVLREIYLKQIEDLKEAIQKITKCANPLANITQRSQDDACLMEIEFRKLRQENDKLDRRIEQAKAETSRILHPYTEELTNLDKCIEKMESAIALAKQRLHVMDEEFNEDFIEQIAQTQTADEIIEEDSLKDGTAFNPLWGGIPHSHVIRDDEEYELKMRSTSLQKLFQSAVEMHEGFAGHYDGFNFSQMQRSKLVKLTKSKARQGHHERVNTDGRKIRNDFYGAGDYKGNKTAPLSVPPPQGKLEVDKYRQQFFGYGGGDSGAPQQFQQREPPLESEIRPSWWD